MACFYPSDHKRREKHFAHKFRVECNEETYLHKLAKQTFHDTYLHCLRNNEPYEIELTHPRACTRHVKRFGTRCNLGSVTVTHDLTQYYTGIRLEKRDERFIPDVLLFSEADESNKVYIEVAVTHFLSEEKRESDNRIIEIHIENEADVEKLRAQKLSEEQASFINFTHTPSPVTDADCLCMRDTFYCLFIYSSGKSVLEDATLSEIEATCKKFGDNLTYVRLVDTRRLQTIPEPGLLFSQLIHEAHEKGFPVRNCLLCRFSGPNWNAFLDNKAIFCKLKRIACTSNEAAACQKFWLRPDISHVDKRRS